MHCQKSGNADSSDDEIILNHIKKKLSSEEQKNNSADKSPEDKDSTTTPILKNENSKGELQNGSNGVIENKENNKTKRKSSADATSQVNKSSSKTNNDLKTESKNKSKSKNEISSKVKKENKRVSVQEEKEKKKKENNNKGKEKDKGNVAKSEVKKEGEKKRETKSKQGSKPKTKTVAKVKKETKSKKDTKVKKETQTKKETKVKKEIIKKPKKLIRKTEEDFEPINRWWEKIEEHSDDIQWKYLEHRGVIFTPPYVQHNIPIFYKGAKVELNAQSEELATYWCSVIGSDYCTKDKFIFNFFNTFIKSLEKDNIIRKENENKVKKGDISNFTFIDFMPIKEHLMKQREERLSKTKEQKEEDKKLKMEKELPYTYALVDWIREKISNNKVEPPGLFRGRGEHPKQGLLKKRIFPEDVVLNISKDAPVPRLQDDMSGHSWKDIYHDNKVTWLAYYKDSINDQMKYTFLSAQSKFKGFKDFMKYENARKLKSCVHKIREDYRKKMCAKTVVNKQLGTAVYLIDFLALRVGGEKDIDEEADTVGCCSLRVEHVSFLHDVPVKEKSVSNDTNANPIKRSSSKGKESNNKNNIRALNTSVDSESPQNNKLALPKHLEDIKEEHCYITLDFLGKDSIRYFNTVKIDKQAYINIITFCKNKKKDEGVFDQINCSKLNEYLKEIMPTLSAKVFRTYNASYTLDQQLKRLKEVYGKPKDFLLSCDQLLHSKKKRKLNPADVNGNLLNVLSDSSDDSMEGGNVKQENNAEPKSKKESKVKKEEPEEEDKKKNPNILVKETIEKDKDSPIEVDVSDVNALINFYNNANREVAILCNHQRSVPKQHDNTMLRIKKQIEVLREDIKEYRKYLLHLKNKNDTKFVFVSKVTLLDGTLRPNKVKENMKEESCKNKLIALIKKVDLLETQMKVKDNNKTIALGTSKINYMDPRITVAFCKKYEIPIEKVFNRSLRLKFPWAMFVTKDFCF